MTRLVQSIRPKLTNIQATGLLVQRWSPTELAAYRRDVSRELRAMENAAEQAVDATRAWLQENWTAYIAATSPNPSLSWTEGIAHTTISNAVGNALTTVGERLLRRLARPAASAAAGAAVGSVIPGAGTALGLVGGFIAGLLVETAASLIYDEVLDRSEEGERAATRASRRTGQLLIPHLRRLEEAATQQKRRIRSDVDGLDDVVSRAGSTDELETIREELRDLYNSVSSPPPSADRSLFNQMIHEWALEHAAERTEATDDVTESQWTEALEDAFGRGELVNRPEAFAYQTRRHLKQLGFDISSAQAIVEALRRSTAGATSSQSSPRARQEARAVLSRYNQRSLRVIGSPESIAAFLLTYGSLNSSLRDALISRAERGLISLRCKLALEVDHGSVLVSAWKYRVAVRPLPWSGRGPFSPEEYRQWEQWNRRERNLEDRLKSIEPRLTPQ